MLGARTMLIVPMVREGQTVGMIFTARREPMPFTESQVALLQTFADQAVIAIENVRLFKELEARTQDLTRSVGELRALGDVGRALSSTLDLDTVLQTIVTRASQLAGTDACTIYEYDENSEQFHLRATHNLDPAIAESMRAMPLRKGQGSWDGRPRSASPFRCPTSARPARTRAVSATRSSPPGTARPCRCRCC